MKQILLTSEDGHELRRNSVDTLIGDTCEDSFDYGFGEGAKAQLRRVVDMLQECDGDLVSRDNKPFMATFEMLAEDWQALLKEIK